MLNLRKAVHVFQCPSLDCCFCLLNDHHWQKYMIILSVIEDDLQFTLYTRLLSRTYSRNVELPFSEV